MVDRRPRPPPQRLRLAHPLPPLALHHDPPRNLLHPLPLRHDPHRLRVEERRPAPRLHDPPPLPPPPRRHRHRGSDPRRLNGE